MARLENSDASLAIRVPLGLFETAEDCSLDLRCFGCGVTFRRDLPSVDDESSGVGGCGVGGCVEAGERDSS
jgi:hypothetical protein